jgi:hypothetical protein
MNLPAQHFDLGILPDRLAKQVRQPALVGLGEMGGQGRKLTQVGVQPWIGNVGVEDAQIPANLLGAFDGVFHDETGSPESVRIWNACPL